MTESHAALGRTCLRSSEVSGMTESHAALGGGVEVPAASRSTSSYMALLAVPGRRLDGSCRGGGCVKSQHCPAVLSRRSDTEMQTRVRPVLLLDDAFSHKANHTVTGADDCLQQRVGEGQQRGRHHHLALSTRTYTRRLSTTSVHDVSNLMDSHS